MGKAGLPRGSTKAARVRSRRAVSSGKEGRARGVGELCEEGRALRGKFKQIFDIKHKRNDTVGITTLILQFSSDYKDLNFQKISYCWGWMLLRFRWHHLVFYCSWRVRSLPIESSQVIETPDCSEDEFHSRCLCNAPKKGRRLAPLPRYTAENLYKYLTSNMKEM